MLILLCDDATPAFVRAVKHDLIINKVIRLQNMFCVSQPTIAGFMKAAG